MSGNIRISGEYDVVVIGAGILGTCSAYYLKKNNPEKKILLVDRNSAVAQGNTARSNAMFRNTFSSEDNQVLTNRSIDYYLALKEDVGVCKSGYLWVMNAEQLRHNERHLKKMVSNGIEISRYSRRELEEYIPSLNLNPIGDEADLIGANEIQEAIFGSKCGRLDPDKLTNHYLNEYLNLGGKVAFNVDVQKLILGAENKLGIEGEPFVWQSAIVQGAELSGELSGRVHAKKFVIACGAWTNALLEPLGIDGHVKAKKRQLFKVRAAGNPDLQKLIKIERFNSVATLPFLILPRSGCFVKSISESQEFWIGCDDDIGQPYLNSPGKDLDECRAQSRYYEDNIRPILRQYLPAFSDEVPSQMWAGFYSYNTVDYLPFVFEEGNAIVVGGDSGSGIMKGDSLGRIVESVYRSGEDSEAELFGGANYPVERIGFKKRKVEREEWVI